jgi:uncharacterized protein YjiS (DUF1127 family)
MVSRLISLLHDWLLRIRSRRDIAVLDRRSLEDLGTTASQMRFEAQKPFWRA